MGVLGVLGPILNNDHFFWFPLQSYSYKNTVGAVACLFFSDPPITPYAIYGRFYDNNGKRIVTTQRNN